MSQENKKESAKHLMTALSYGLILAIFITYL